MLRVFDSRGSSDTAQLPTVDDLSGEWMAATDLLHPPSVTNFWGGLKSTSNVLAFDSLTLPPYAQGGETCRLQLGGQDVTAQKSRWYPYQVLRRASAGPIDVDTVATMECEANTVLLQMTFSNSGGQNEVVEPSVLLSARIGHFDGPWSWEVPRPADDKAFIAHADASRKTCTIVDTRSPTATCFAFVGPLPHAIRKPVPSADWTFNLGPGRRITIGIVMSVARNKAAAMTAAIARATGLNRSLKATRRAWQQRWTEAFTPGNRHFSGHLPVLHTADAQLSRVYYMSVMTLLQMERTNLPTLPRAFVTAGPRWAVTLTYFWDTSLTAALLAMLDPAMLRAQLEQWLTVDIRKGYAIDMLRGRLTGPWYAANAFSVLKTVITYVDYTGDVAFLDRVLAGKRVVDRVINLTDDWRQLVVPSTGLADFGGMTNLLEQVPNYVNQVPSLNGATVWMLRETARLCRYVGRHDQSSRLEGDAANLLPRVLNLDVDGAGYWRTVHDSGAAVPVRHVYDFATLGCHIPTDLGPSTRQDMLNFVSRELAQHGWLRALSQGDPDAAVSLRPDHGSTGAYDAWAALAASSVARLGDADGALEMLRGFATVTREGPFSQSHQFVDPTGSAQTGVQVRISSPSQLQDYNASNGGSFAVTIIEDVFGYRPVAGRPALGGPGGPRGVEGSLRDLPARTSHRLVDVELTTSGRQQLHLK